MKKSIPIWQVAGFVFTAILGTFLHFLFDMTGGSLWAALFSAVNESIWEHVKLLFYPMYLFAIIEYYAWGKEYKQFWCVKLLGMALGLLLIPVIYYTYIGILGRSADWFNVTIFFLAAGAAYWVQAKQFQKDTPCTLHPAVAFSLICLIAVVFTVLTFLPPPIPFFSGSGHRNLRVLGTGIKKGRLKAALLSSTGNSRWGFLICPAEPH